MPLLVCLFFWPFRDRWIKMVVFRKIFSGIFEKKFFRPSRATAAADCFLTGGAPPLTKTDRRTDADTLKSAHSSSIAPKVYVDARNEWTNERGRLKPFTGQGASRRLSPHKRSCAQVNTRAHTPKRTHPHKHTQRHACTFCERCDSTLLRIR